MVTLDAHLLALDMRTGAIVWDATLEQYKNGYASTIAPIVVKDKVIVGAAGGEFGIRGFIDAYDGADGQARVALLHDSRAGRTGQRHVGGRFVEDRRRQRVGDRRLRSRAEPALLRHRQSGPRLSQREPAGRQPLRRVDRGARRRHREASLALPVHAARRARLGLRPRCRSSPTSRLRGSRARS